MTQKTTQKGFIARHAKTVAIAAAVAFGLSFIAYDLSVTPSAARFIERCEPQTESIRGSKQNQRTERVIPADYLEGFQPNPGCEKLVCTSEGTALNPSPEKCEPFTKAGFDAAVENNIKANAITLQNLNYMMYGMIVLALGALVRAFFCMKKPKPGAVPKQHAE